MPQQLEHRLAALANRLSNLVSADPQLNDTLDFAIGAIHSLIRATKLGYHDRDFPLPVQYWDKVRRQGENISRGQEPDSHAWLAGYYFNSAIMRIAAVYDRLEGLRLARDQGGGSKRQLLRGVHPAFQKGAAATEVAGEVNKLKHDPQGLAPSRRATLVTAAQALEELADAMERAKGQIVPRCRKRGAAL